MHMDRYIHTISKIVTLFKMPRLTVQLILTVIWLNFIKRLPLHKVTFLSVHPAHLISGVECKTMS